VKAKQFYDHHVGVEHSSPATGTYTYVKPSPQPRPTMDVRWNHPQGRSFIHHSSRAKQTNNTQPNPCTSCKRTNTHHRNHYHPGHSTTSNSFHVSRRARSMLLVYILGVFLFFSLGGRCYHIRISATMFSFVIIIAGHGTSLKHINHIQNCVLNTCERIFIH